MSSGKKVVSPIKLPPGFLEEICMYSDEKQNGQKSRSVSGSSSRKRLSFVKHSDKILEEALQYSSKSEEYKLKYSAAEFMNLNSARKSTLTSRPSIAANIYKIRKSTTSRSAKKEVKAKTINSLNNYLHKTSKQENIQKKDLPLIIIDYVGNTAKAPVRKALFKGPTAKRSLDTIPETSISQLQSKITTRKIIFDQSPLIDIDKAEDLLSKKSISRANINNPTPMRAAGSQIIQEETKDLLPSPNGTTGGNFRKHSSDTEFEALEELYQKDCPPDLTENINKIRSIMRQEKESFVKRIVEHDRRMLELDKLLNKLEKCFSKNINNKANQPSPQRQSKPIFFEKTQSKVETKNNSSNRAYDLRVNLLKSKLEKNEIGTPKVLTAKKMYDSLRQNFTMLNTPKFDRTLLKSEEKNMSTKIQQQCILLLETPRKN